MTGTADAMSNPLVVALMFLAAVVLATEVASGVRS